MFASPVSAQQFENCTKTERGQFGAALDRAERLALTATTAIGPNPTYTRWFGQYDQKSGEIVRQNLKGIVAALRSTKVVGNCPNNGEDLCDENTFAFVDKDDPFLVYVCAGFFKMDTMKQLTLESAVDGNGTRAGTLIHEVSHFTIVADTEDICYSRGDCTKLALDAPQDALMNADSYQFFVEDATFFGVGGALDTGPQQ